ncbi:hypothetical protein R1S95_001410 [Listeria monocytogenes]|nr:hypothetical protein [Listeria monocytogenes]
MKALVAQSYDGPDKMKYMDVTDLTIKNDEILTNDTVGKYFSGSINQSDQEIINRIG